MARTAHCQRCEVIVDRVRQNEPCLLPGGLSHEEHVCYTSLLHEGRLESVVDPTSGIVWLTLPEPRPPSNLIVEALGSLLEWLAGHPE